MNLLSILGHLLTDRSVPDAGVRINVYEKLYGIAILRNARKQLAARTMRKARNAKSVAYSNEMKNWHGHLDQDIAVNCAEHALSLPAQRVLKYRMSTPRGRMRSAWKT